MKTCPLGHTCADCLWHTRIRGTNPNTGAEVDQEGCAIAWLPVLLVENSQQQRQTAASVDSFRNEMVNGNDAMLQLMQSAAQKRLTQ